MNDWQIGWEPGQLAKRLLLVGDDEALAWATTEEQVRYVANVYGWPKWRVRQIVQNRAAWAQFFENTNKNEKNKNDQRANQRSDC